MESIVRSAEALADVHMTFMVAILALDSKAKQPHFVSKDTQSKRENALPRAGPSSNRGESLEPAAFSNSLRRKQEQRLQALPGLTNGSILTADRPM